MHTVASTRLLLLVFLLACLAVCSAQKVVPATNEYTLSQQAAADVGKQAHTEGNSTQVLPTLPPKPILRTWRAAAPPPPTAAVAAAGTATPPTTAAPPTAAAAAGAGASSSHIDGVVESLVTGDVSEDGVASAASDNTKGPSRAEPSSAAAAQPAAVSVASTDSTESRATSNSRRRAAVATSNRAKAPRSIRHPASSKSMSEAQQDYDSDDKADEGVKDEHEAATTTSSKDSSSSKDHSSSSSKKNSKKDGSSSSNSSSKAAATRGDTGSSDVHAQEDNSSSKSSKHVAKIKTCPLWHPDATDQGLTTADRPAALSVFSELTVDEYNAVLSFLYGQEELGLVDIVSSDPDGALTVANYVHAIHLEAPPKHEMLAYLDHEAPKPARKARATLVLGEADPPVVRDVVMTLHDEGDSLTVSDLKKVNILSSKLPSLPIKQRPQGHLDENGVIAALADATHKLNEVFADAFDGFIYGDECDDKCIDFSLTFAQTFETKGVVRAAYVQFFWYTEEAGDGNYLHPVPVQALCGASDKRLEDWSVVRLWFAGRHFDTPEALAQAWKDDNKGLRSNFYWEAPAEEDSLFATFKKRPGHRRAADQPVGPIPWEPYGRRFTITHGNKVDWLGWSLYVGYLPHHGGRFWDIRFKGERIVYELSLQEAMAVYGAGDLTQANTVFLDSSFGMGYNLRELLQGIDCPMTAAFMDADIFYSGMSGPTTYKNAICVFEHSPNMPVLRHYSSAYKYYGAVPGAQLIVRMISTVYNYDYIQDLVLGVDGTLDVKVTTSGYIQATSYRTFYPQHYGFPVSHNVSGTVHTHVLAWKVDVDVAGTDNSLNLLKFKSHKTDNGLGGDVYVNRFDAQIIETEDESGYVQQMHEPKMPVVIAEHKHNKWGSPRGYKVQLNRPLANLEPEGYPRSAGLGFWKWNFVATKRNEHETHSSSLYSQADLAHPPTCLTNYVNGESIRREDLVVWVNAGLYHVPMAEDAPVTPASGHNQLGFSLIPYNWADENPATDMADMFTVDGAAVNSTSPAVKKALRRCRPKYTNTRFGSAGFEGTTHTDEDVAALATADVVDSDERDSSGSGSNKGGDSSKSKSGKQKRSKSSHADPSPASTQSVKAASTSATPTQVRPRSCRKSKRWAAC